MKAILVILVIALLAVAPAQAAITPSQAKEILGDEGVYPSAYIEDGKAYWFTITVGQAQWIYQQAGIKPAASIKASDLIKNLYIYDLSNMQRIHNIKDADSGYPILFLAKNGPLVKVAQEDFIVLDGDLYQAYTWYEIVSLGYPELELVEYTVSNGAINSAEVIGGPYNATTIPSYNPQS